MNISLKLALCLILAGCSTAQQGPPPKGSQTSPVYSPEQLRQFNNQPVALTEGPFGPVATPPQKQGLSRQSPGDSKYFNQPQGEQEAEAIETQSADPIQPGIPIYRF
jgi:hypothetical protein